MILGIDPQRTLIATHLRGVDGKTADWRTFYLKKKSAFKGAQSWQTYIHEKCFEILEDYATYHHIRLVVIEQQRGRINSIIEQSLLVCCMALELEASIMHPLKWKSLSGVSCKGSNKKNKDHVEQMVSSALEEYFSQKGEKLPKRIHDLCDAYLLSEAGRIESNLKCT
jgi:uncharacterized iron-regulated protein